MPAHSRKLDPEASFGDWRIPDRGCRAVQRGHTAHLKMLRCSTMQRIGVRELRQQASRYLKRVQAGEAFEVTDNGRPVARLVPVPPDAWHALIDSGQVVPAELPGGLLDIEPRDFGIDSSAELAAMRALEDR